MNLQRRVSLFICLTAVFLLLSGFGFYLFDHSPELVWTMVNVNNSRRQGDAHVIQVKPGKVILIDTGYAGPASAKLVPFLRRNNLLYLDYVFISHPHRDHYEGLRSLIKSNVQIGAVYFNLPDKGLCDSERPWGCDYQDLLTLREELQQNKIEVLEARKGLVIPLGEKTEVEILYAFDGMNTPVGRIGVNDLSLIMMLRHGNRKMLFTGDLNKKIGGYLAGYPNKIRADVLKVPHHGVEQVAPNDFFKAVNPALGMVPAPGHLWLSQRGARVRTWFEKNDIPVYVNGLHGDIQVLVENDEVRVQTEQAL